MMLWNWLMTLASLILIPGLCVAQLNESSPDVIPTELYISTATPPSVKKMLGYSYGHAAMRFRNPESDFDMIYSFDSNLSNNSLQMIRGVFTNSQEKITRIEQYDDYMNNAKKIGRSVTFQRLNLTQKEILKIFLAMKNIREDKDIKRYHPIYANCSNGLLDLLKQQTNLIIPNTLSGTTLRQEIERYCGSYYVWFNVLQNIGAGVEADKPMSSVEAAFLPAYLGSLLEKSRIMRRGSSEPLVVETFTIDYRFDRVPQKHAIYNRPNAFIWIITIASLLFITFAGLKKRESSQLWVGVIFIVYGVLGVIFWVFDLILDYGVTWRNPMLVLFNPLELIFGILWCSKKQQKMIYYYLPIQALATLTLMIFAYNYPLPIVTPVELLLVVGSTTAFIRYVRMLSNRMEVAIKKA